MGIEQIKATLVDHMGSDLSTVNAARVSFGKESNWCYASCPDPHGMPPELVEEYKKLSDKDTKLIKYLAKHKHLSPFGHAFASFHVKAPIFVARQLVKHKFLRWNEISRRYVDDEPEFYNPDTWRCKAEDKKQGSADWSVPYTTWPLKVKTGYNQWEGDEYSDFNTVVLELYEHLLAVNIAPEQARMVLPQSTMTEWYWSGSLDAFAAMCKLRCAPDSQYESQIVANQINNYMVKLYPVSWSALMEIEDDSTRS